MDRETENKFILSLTEGSTIRSTKPLKEFIRVKEKNLQPVEIAAIHNVITTFEEYRTDSSKIEPQLRTEYLQSIANVLNISQEVEQQKRNKL